MCGDSKDGTERKRGVWKKFKQQRNSGAQSTCGLIKSSGVPTANEGKAVLRDTLWGKQQKRKI